MAAPLTLNLHQLRLFCKVVERGSFSLASRELLLSQPALSIQVKRLERSLGLQLLLRTRGGAVLTPAGRELYSTASALLGQAQITERRLQALRAGKAGTLTIGVSHTAALYILTQLVEAFGGAHPLVQLDIDVEDELRLLPRLRTGSLDAVLDWGPSSTVDLQTTLLFSERFGVVASARHPQAAVGAINRDELLATPLIMLQHAPDAPLYMDVWLAEHGLLPTTVKRMPSIDAIKRLVEANLGLTVLSRSAVAREIQAGYLVWLDVEGLVLERPLVLLTRRQRLAPLTAQFLAFARHAAPTLTVERPPHPAPQQLGRQAARTGTRAAHDILAEGHTPGVGEERRWQRNGTTNP
jgi:DNA-binding transcriptional LysR family regulator